jgi:hypothetical protein
MISVAMQCDYPDLHKPWQNPGKRSQTDAVKRSEMGRCPFKFENTVYTENYIRALQALGGAMGRQNIRTSTSRGV